MAPSVFQQTHLQEEPLWDKCQAFDLLRKPLYCLLQKCPEAEAASFPSWGFKHMMAILSIFSPFKFLFILVIWDRREGSTWMATTHHSLSNRSLLSRRIFPPIVSFLLGIKTFFHPFCLWSFCCPFLKLHFVGSAFFEAEMIKAALRMLAIFTINSIFWVIFHSHFNAAHSPCLFFKLSLCVFDDFVSNR